MPNHLDPLGADTPRPDPASWSPRWRRAFRSTEMEAFREGLRLRGLPDTRSAVLDDLSSFFHVDAEEVLYRCTHSYELGAREWDERTGQGGAAGFYRNVTSLSFGLLWYAYLQAEGYAPPVAVMIAQDMQERPPAAVLDFGSGVGAAAMMFSILGYRATLADIAVPLLEFAEFRFSRRGHEASFLDLNERQPEDDAYQAVAAIQTFASVPSIPVVARRLHRALKEGGTLYADFDVQPRSGSDTRLYDDDLPLRRAVHAVGFAEKRRLDGFSIRYQKIAPGRIGQYQARVRDAFLLGPPRYWWRQLRYR